MIASLSMYDWPETGPALDRLWSAIRDNLKDAGLQAPEHLQRDREVYEIWRDPALVIGQTCGWPYISRLRGEVIPFARFAYELDCEPGHYYSVFIGRDAGDRKYLQDAAALQLAPKVAINGDDSQSGFRVFRDVADAGGEAIAPENRLITGSHRQSVKAVAERQAAIAAIDGVAFLLSADHDPAYHDNICVLAKSKPVPGLPLITTPTNKAKTGALFDAVQSAIGQVSAADRKVLKIIDLVPARDADYELLL